MGQVPSNDCSNSFEYDSHCADEYLSGWYGVSALWYGILQIVLASLIILSDLIFMSVFFSSSALRNNAANRLLLGLVLTDCFHYLCLFVGAVALVMGYVAESKEHTLFCQITGTFIVTTATCSFGFPGLIAAQRYYSISHIPSLTGKFSAAESIFGNKRLIPLMIVWYISSAALNLPLILFKSFGEDIDGYCGAKLFTEFLQFAMYLFAVVAVFTLSYIFTGVYYYRLGRFLRNQRTTSTNRESIHFTRSLMLMTKIIVILPLFTMTPTMGISAGQWLLYGVLPMWSKRAICSFYYIPACITPWAAIYTLRPFRNQFKKLFFSAIQRFKAAVAFFRPLNSTNGVQSEQSVRIRVRRSTIKTIS